MSTTATPARGRGRPRAFDEGEVLDSLIDLFADQGFEAASLSDIVEAAGLNKSSLYNAFGSKDELFRRVLDRYIDIRAELLDTVTSDERGLDALLDLVELVRAEALSEGGRRGCLAINSTAELGQTSDAMAGYSQRYRDVLRSHVRRPLQRAAALGEIRADMVDVYVDAAVSFMVAAALTARGGASPAEIDHHLDSMRRLVESWRTTSPAGSDGDT
jgi:TetR/AcrR family transcriptional repressor of nem operon